jgi:hypothetical protein
MRIAVDRASAKTRVSTGPAPRHDGSAPSEAEPLRAQDAAMPLVRPPADLLALQRLIARRASPRAEAEPSAMESAQVHDAAKRGTSGASEPLPFLDTIQRSFGTHDVSGVAAHTDRAAASAARAIDATAFTTGDHVAFADKPSLRTAAHEAAHVIQQRDGVQLEGGVGAAGDRYERHADAVADQVVQGNSAEALLDEHLGESAGTSVQREIPTGTPRQQTSGVGACRVQREDGKQTGSTLSDSPSFKAGGSPLRGKLQVSSWLIQELIKQGQLSPQMLQLIQSGQLEIKPDAKSASTATDGATEGGAKSLATEFNTLPSRFLGSGAGFSIPSLDLLGSPKITPPSLPTPQWVRTGGYSDPVIGYIPPQLVKWTPPTPSSPQPAGEPNLWQTSLAQLQPHFDFSDGLTINSISNPGISTSIFVTGAISRVSTKGGLGIQTELGWDKSVGLQLSYRDWYFHGTLDTDGKWGLTLSFPNDSPIPIMPWVNDIFREAGVAIQGFTKAAAAGPPNLNNLDPLINLLTPHLDRMKNAIDAAKGIAKAQPGVNVALAVGSGPRPGATPSEKRSGIYLGLSMVGTF